MTNQTETTITAEEMKATLERHFSGIIGNLALQNLSLEKRIAILETSQAQLRAELLEGKIKSRPD